MKIFDVNVKFHWSYGLLPLYFLITFGPVGLLYSVILTVSVLGHEFAHIFVARQYGLEARKVLMSFIGGLAYIQQTHFGYRPWQDIWIAAAGPIFSISLAFPCFLTLYLTPGTVFWNGQAFSFFGSLLAMTGAMNLVLAIFNLLPAYPSDGGRILRNAIYLLTKKKKVAVDISQMLSLFFGMLFVGLGAANFSIGLAIIGLAILFALYQEKYNNLNV